MGRREIVGGDEGKNRMMYSFFFFFFPSFLFPWTGSGSESGENMGAGLNFHILFCFFPLVCISIFCWRKKRT